MGHHRVQSETNTHWKDGVAQGIAIAKHDAQLHLEWWWQRCILLARQWFHQTGQRRSGRPYRRIRHDGNGIAGHVCSFWNGWQQMPPFAINRTFARIPPLAQGLHRQRGSNRAAFNKQVGIRLFNRCWLSWWQQQRKLWRNLSFVPWLARNIHIIEWFPHKSAQSWFGGVELQPLSLAQDVVVVVCRWVCQFQFTSHIQCSIGWKRVSSRRTWCGRYNMGLQYLVIVQWQHSNQPVRCNKFTWQPHGNGGLQRDWFGWFNLENICRSALSRNWKPIRTHLEVDGWLQVYHPKRSIRRVIKILRLRWPGEVHGIRRRQLRLSRKLATFRWLCESPYSWWGWRNHAVGGRWWKYNVFLRLLLYEHSIKRRSRTWCFVRRLCDLWCACGVRVGEYE